MRDVLVVGGIFREIIRRPDDEEPEIRLAGSALTAAVAASRFGASVAIASFVGSEDADAAHSLLEHASVDTQLIVLDGASGTFAYAGDAEADNPQPLYRPAETCPTALPALPKARVLLAFGVPDFDPVRDLEVQASARTARTFIWDRQGWLSRTATRGRRRPWRSRTGCSSRMLLRRSTKVFSTAIPAKSGSRPASTV